jgi:chromosome segregation ATPase
MTDETNDGLRDRLQRTGEDALGRLAQELLDSPLVTGAIARALEAREKAVQAQELAMGALNLPSAADLERLTRRLRAVSQRLEGIEDGVDRLDERLAAVGRAPRGVEALEAQLDAVATRLEHIEARLDQPAAPAGAAGEAARLEQRLHGVEEQLAGLAIEVRTLRGELPGGPTPLPPGQERLAVEPSPS